MSDRSALPQRILLVRHGATEWSAAGKHTGTTDLPLTGAGRDQADQLPQLIRPLLGGETPLVFTSPLQRARDTAQRAMPRDAATVVDALAEIDYGSYDGLTTKEIRATRPTWDLFTDATPGGESLNQVTARCDSFIAKLERTAADRVVVAFTHGHLSRVLACRLLGLPGAAAAVWHNDTASIGVLTRRHGRLVLTGWNLRH
jgi:broad specificity phosphatase PhoE